MAPCVEGRVTEKVVAPSEEMMAIETLDDFRKAVAEITAEERAREPNYHKWIRAFTGLKNAYDLRTLLFIAYYFASLYWLWNWEKLMPTKLGGSEIIDWGLYMTIWYSNIYFSILGSVMTHNTMHSALYTSSYANKAVQLLLTLTYGHPVSSYVPGHNLSHHKYTQSKKDVMNSYLVNSKYHSWNLLSFQPKVGLSVMQSDFRYIMFQKHRGNWKFVSQALRELAFLLVVQTALMYSNITKWMLYFYIPHFVAQYAIVTLSLLQHDGCELFDRNATSINWNTSRNFTSDFLNFFCLNNGYHTVHHLVPTTHWSLCKVVHDRLVQGRTDDRLVWPSMANFILHQYFYNGNPWNKNKKRRMYNGAIDIEPKSKSEPVPIIEPISASTASSSETSSTMTRRRTSSKGNGVNRVGATKVRGSSLPKDKQNTLMYEEWLSFPDNFDRESVPQTKQELGANIGLLLLKLIISPLYSIEPGLRLV